MVWQVQQQMQGFQKNPPLSTTVQNAGTSWPQLPIPLPAGAVIKHWEASQQWIIWEVQVGAKPSYWLIYDLQAQRIRIQLMPVSETN